MTALGVFQAESSAVAADTCTSAPTTFNTATGRVTDGTYSASYSYSILQSAGYGAATPAGADGLVLDVANGAANPDSITVRYNVSGVTSPGHVIRLVGGSFNTVNGDNAASDYTISWTGGTGSATWYDPATPDVTMYRWAPPAGFDINERQIEGLGTSGTLANGGTIRVYDVSNAVTEWYVDLPRGATSVTVSKVVLHGGTSATTGIDFQYPALGYGSSGSGTSFREWIAFDTLLCRDTDLVTVKTLESGNATPSVGDTVGFRINVVNNGPDAATNVALTDQVPAGLTFVSATPGAGGYDAATGIWTIGTLANGASASLVLTATVNADQGGQGITNTTTPAAGDQGDPSTAGDDLTESIMVLAQPDLVTVKSLLSANATPAVGDSVTFRLMVTNATAGVTATGVSLNDQMPVGLTYASHVASAGTYDPATGAWTIGSVVNGTPATLDITATVDAGQQGNLITNTATPATGDQPDPSMLGDDLMESVTVFNPQPALVLAKTWSFVTDANGDGKAGTGDVVRYAYAVTNTGNVNVANVSVSDTTNGNDPAFLGGASPGQPVAVSLTTDAGTVGDSTDADNAGPVWDTLAPGDTVTFTADYSVVQADVDALQ
ncbi:DUF11 domain-containing protein [Zhengella mangrovi]|uniref:DUF11 domain-containing protein n=1 Tax=Zhengella mangrovi TaxID=1982044 RepID=UPI0013FD9ADE|nr:DUF11 domain-containing protein [Zhengella mangrovi]